MRLRKLLLFIGLIGVVAVLTFKHYEQRAASLPLVWTQIAMNLPPSIKVYAGTSPYQGAPVRAWHIDIDYNDTTLRAQPWLSKSAAGREVGSAMARQLNAVVAINGGYFDMQSVPARTFSLVMHDGKVLVPNVAVVKRPNLGHVYPVTRSAFGIRADRSFDVAWVAQQGDTLWIYPKPVAHSVTTVAPAPTRDYPPGGHAWDAVDAIGGGPTLISDGV
ncbi:MAG: hypothetical protein JOZ57_11285, partial [Abitibacteriaceae bacterium]|nr:hypothetical protein [Abditibacteriaceae bacterium]